MRRLLVVIGANVLAAACSFVNVPGGTGTSTAGGEGGEGGHGGGGGHGGVGGHGAASVGTAGHGGAGGSGGAPVVWKAYDYRTNIKSWKVAIAVTEAFPAIDKGNPNAPPPSGWLASVYLSDLSRLLVFVDDGMLYRRDLDTWQAPAPIDQVFSGVEPAKLRSATQVSYEWSKAWDPNTDKEITLTLVSNPVYHQFHYPLQGDKVVAFATGNLSSDTNSGEPDRKNGIESYAFLVFDLQQKGEADGFNGWYQYDDGKVYRIDALLKWTSWPAGLSPYWKREANAAPLTGLEAAYHDTDNQFVRFIGP